MRKTFFIIFILFIVPEVHVAAQTYLRISGTVTDAETKEPIPGVTVVLKGTSKTAFTELDGSYAIDALAENEYLEFSFVGLKTLTITIAGRDRIDVEMQPDIVTLHEWLVCGKSFLEPTVSTSSLFPLVIGTSLLDKKLNYCCNTRYNLNLGLLYGTDFRSNQLFHSRASISNIGIPKVPLGVASEYNYLYVSRSNKDTLISDYRVSLILNRILKNISFEAGAGRQSYNDLSNIGFGGKLSILNEFDDSYPKFTWDIHSGFWYWGDYYEYSLGLNLYLNSRKTITEISMRRIRVGCELKQTDNIRFVSVSLGIRYLIKKQVIGCG